MSLEVLRGARLAALFGIVACSFLVYWYPFSLDPPRRIENSARRAADGSIEVDALSRVNIALPESARSMFVDGVWALQVEARPTRINQTGPARLVDTARDPYEPGFMIGVDGTALVLRMPCSTQGRSAEWRLPLQDAAGDPISAIVSQDGPGENPRLAIGVRSFVPPQSPCEEGLLSPPFSPDTPWTLGNVRSGHRPFEGTILRLTLTQGGTAIDLLRESHLDQPQAFWILPERYFQPAVGEDGDVLPALWHFAGFFVVGLLLVSGSRPMTPQRAFLAGLALLLVLNAGKLVIAGRHVDVQDLMLNAFGLALGTWVARRASPRPTAESGVGHHD